MTTATEDAFWEELQDMAKLRKCMARGTHAFSRHSYSHRGRILTAYCPDCRTQIRDVVPKFTRADVFLKEMAAL